MELQQFRRGQLAHAGITGGVGAAIARGVIRELAAEAAHEAQNQAKGAVGKLRQWLEPSGPAPAAYAVPHSTPKPRTVAPKARAPAPQAISASSQGRHQPATSSPAFKAKVGTVRNRAKKSKSKSISSGPAARRATTVTAVAVRNNEIDWSLPTPVAEKFETLEFSYIAYTPKQVTSGTDPFTTWGEVNQYATGTGTSTGNGAELQPGTSFGSLTREVAIRYVWWRFKRLRIAWKPFAASADRGKVYVIVDPANNTVQPKDPQAVIASCLQINSSIGAAWERDVPLGALRNRWVKVRRNRIFGAERDSYDLGRIWLDTDSTNLPADAKLGVLEVSGEVELRCVQRPAMMGTVDARSDTFTISANTFTTTTTDLGGGIVANTGENHTGAVAGPTGLTLPPGVYRVTGRIHANTATFSTGLIRWKGSALIENEYNLCGVPPAVPFVALAQQQLVLPPVYVTVNSETTNNLLSLEVITTGTTSITIPRDYVVGGATGLVSYLELTRVDV